MKKLIIAGATGMLGKKLTKLLSEKGYSVSVFTRNPEKAGFLIPDALEFVKWEPDKPDSWASKIDGSFGVINLAGASIAGKRWTSKQKQLILKSRVESTAKFADVISAVNHPPEFFFNASAVGYYGNTEDFPVDESSFPGKGFLAGVCSDWENATEPASTKCRVIKGRTGLVLDKTEGALPKLLLPFKFYFGVRLGSGRQWCPWIHIDDEVRMIEWSISDSRVSGPVNFTSPNPATMNHLIKSAAHILRKPSFVRIPPFVIKILLGEMSEVILNGQKVIPSKALELGYEYKYPYLKEALINLL